MQPIFEILFLVGNPGKICKGKSQSKGKSNLLHPVPSPEQTK